MSQRDVPTQRPAERYGDPTPGQVRRRRRLLLAAVAALGAAGIGFAAWVGFDARGEVTLAPRGYEHVGEGVLRVTFAVTRQPASALVCEVEALSSDSAQVGLATVDVPPSEEATVLVTADVRTSERPVTGRAVGCEPA